MAKLCGGRLVVEMGRVATVRLANPRKANPLSLDLMRALHGALDEIDADPSVRALQLTHDGAWFSSGHDIHDLFHISAGACKVRVRAAARCFQPYGGRLHTHTHTHTHQGAPRPSGGFLTSDAPGWRRSQAREAAQLRGVFSACSALTMRLHSMRQPTVASVHGSARRSASAAAPALPHLSRRRRHPALAIAPPPSRRRHRLPRRRRPPRRHPACAAGHASAGGAQLVAACDVVVAGREAQFSALWRSELLRSI